MHPRSDQYSNKTQNRIDLVLMVVIVLTIVFACRISAHARTTSNEPKNAPLAQKAEILKL